MNNKKKKGMQKATLTGLPLGNLRGCGTDTRGTGMDENPLRRALAQVTDPDQPLPRRKESLRNTSRCVVVM